MPKLQKKQQGDDDQDTIEFDLDNIGTVEDAKDADFDLNMDSARFQGSKGQAGSRSRSQ